MAIQFPDFQRISFAEANPMLAGVQSGQDIFSNVLKQHLTSLANKKAEAELPYAGLLAKSSADYKTAMAKYLSNPYQSQRFMTPLGKLLNEQQMRALGVVPAQSGNETSPDGSNPAMPGAPQQTGLPATQYAPTNTNRDNGVDYYGKEIEKTTTDPDTRKRNLFVNNIDKTIGTINPDDLTRYSGIPGMIKEGGEMFKSALGHASPEYTAHLDSARSAQQLASQVRQFYGDSIQKSSMDELNSLTNPSFWKNSPDVAKELYNKYINLLHMESGTYQQALNTPNQGKQAPGAMPQRAPSNAQSNVYTQGKVPPPDSIWMKRPDGKIVSVHNSNVARAMKESRFQEVG